MPPTRPASRLAPTGLVCADDHLAAQAGVAALRAGGSAADAAVAASAVLAVTCQHMCGMGGDLFALVHRPGAERPFALNASGRAGSGADPDRLRAEGHHRMPVAGDIRSVPVPGCVDGWLALHERFGRLPLADVLADAVRYAEDGFPASPLLAATAPNVAGVPGGEDFAVATRPGATVRRPGAARALRAITASGRDGFYGGEFGAGLLHLGSGEYTSDDLAEANADWVEPLSAEAWGHRLWTTPPNSQGYLTLAGAWIAERAGLPVEPGGDLWAHVGVEAARQASFDRLDVLHEHADGRELISERRLAPRAAAVDPDRAALLGGRFAPGGTTFLCAVDGQRMGVSLIQSNATGFGAAIAEPSTGIFLHNRGIGFSLVAGHPAEYGPRRRPPHTLSPVLVTRSGELAAVAGTMGGDSQPQILLQVLARVLHGGQDAAEAVGAPRWVLRRPASTWGFETWEERGTVEVCLEPGCPEAWEAGLLRRGHAVRPEPGNYGHAQLIVSRGEHLEGAADPRALVGDAAGY
ncbi:MAG TPA: gamma-glutamyltransferase [Acidimicrobiales bacterium]|nr:gamma-glutamyltransferase [Acidimicrobiales bacterium]